MLCLPSAATSDPPATHVDTAAATTTTAAAAAAAATTTTTTTNNNNNNNNSNNDGNNSDANDTDNDNAACADGLTSSGLGNTCRDVKNRPAAGLGIQVAACCLPCPSQTHLLDTLHHTLHRVQKCMMSAL